MATITINGIIYDFAHKSVSSREIQAWIPNTTFPIVFGCGNTLREQLDSAKKSMQTQIAKLETPSTC